MSVVQLFRMVVLPCMSEGVENRWLHIPGIDNGRSRVPKTRSYPEIARFLYKFGWSLKTELFPIFWSELEIWQQQGGGEGGTFILTWDSNCVPVL